MYAHKPTERFMETYIGYFIATCCILAAFYLILNLQVKTMSQAKAPVATQNPQFFYNARSNAPDEDDTQEDMIELLRAKGFDVGAKISTEGENKVLKYFLRCGNAKIPFGYAKILCAAKSNQRKFELVYNFKGSSIDYIYKIYAYTSDDARLAAANFCKNRKVELSSAIMVDDESDIVWEFGK